MAQSALHMQERTLQSILTHLDLNGALADFNRFAVIRPADAVAALTTAANVRDIRTFVQTHFPHDDIRIPIEDAMIDAWMRDRDMEWHRYVQTERNTVLENKLYLLHLLQQQMTAVFDLHNPDAAECARCMLEGAHVGMLLTGNVEWIALLQQCWPADKARPSDVQQHEFAGAMHRLGTDAMRRMTAALARMRDARDGLSATRKRKRGCDISDEEGAAADASAALPVEVQHAVRVVRDAMHSFAATNYTGNDSGIDPATFARLFSMNDSDLADEIGAMEHLRNVPAFLQQRAAQDVCVRQALETLQQFDFNDLYT